MDDVSSTLLDRLVDKTLENMDQEERLAFIEKLFLDLPVAAQQEFLLQLARQNKEAEEGGYGRSRRASGRRGPGPIRHMMAQGPPGFGPWHMCCQAMNDLVELPAADPSQTADIARIFNAMADETRLKIVKLLSEREYSVDEMVQALGIAQSTTSHHLRILKEAGIVRGEKRGRSVYYSLIPAAQE
jgi:DNA-binding HxlR family transcriptional regulator